MKKQTRKIRAVKSSDDECAVGKEDGIFAGWAAL